MKWDVDRYKNVFDDLREKGWDMDSSLDWSFYFVSKSIKKLDEVFIELLEKEYKKIEISKNDLVYRLQVSKSEVMTPDKLVRRNFAFDDLADYVGDVDYDGWDVKKNE